jgi:2-isopropylmalate synthase
MSGAAAGRRVLLYDATLREGAQAEGISFSASGKLRVARLLDAFGVDYVEGGFVSSNPKDEAFFRSLRDEPLARARLVAFGMTCRAGKNAARDPGLRALAACGAPAVALVGKAAAWQVRSVLRTTAKENLRLVRDSVDFLKQAGREVLFDAEHFFDGFAENPDAAIAVLAAALGAGADAAVLCDTNGGTLPDEIAAAVRTVRHTFPDARLGIHAHNDCGLALANTLRAIGEGAELAQATVNGYGERAGNADFCALLPVLALKLGREAACAASLPRLTALSREIDEAAGQRPDARRPFVGEGVFAHKAGLHVDGVGKAPKSFEQIDPAAVGNHRRVLVSELSGTGGVSLKAGELGYGFGKHSAAARDVLRRLSELEADGYAFEAADASFQLLVEKVLHRHRPFFTLEGFSVVVQKRSAGSPATTTATIKVRVGGQTELTAGEGVGPVDALNAALRKVLHRFYPAVDAVVLEDFNVRILDPETATGAETRVRIDSSDGTHHWGTVGVSANIIEASWQALVDSVEYKLLLDGAEAVGKKRKS